MGKTLVKYRDVTVGRVSAVGLSADHQTVLVSADLSKDAASLLKADTQFWIVRPRIGVGSVSGLDTLLSGVYIGLKTGAATLSESQFVGIGESARSFPRSARSRASVACRARRFP